MPVQPSKKTTVEPDELSAGQPAGYLQIIGRSCHGLSQRYTLDKPLANAFVQYAKLLGLGSDQVHFQCSTVVVVDGGMTLKDLGGPELVIIEAVTQVDHLRDLAGAAIQGYMDRHHLSSVALFAQLCLSSSGVQKV